MPHLLTAVLWVVLCLIPLAQAAETQPVRPYQAHYTVYASGLPVGEAITTLSYTGSDTYHMTSDVRPNGLAVMLTSSSIHEQVNGVLRDGQIQPLRYERQVEAGKRSEQLQLQFDWAAGRVQAKVNARQTALALVPGVVDPLSLQLLVRRDLQNGQLRDRYQLADQAAVKTYQIRNQGQETLETPLGRQTVVRVQQFEPGKTRKTTFWLASGLGYLPVRIMQEKKGAEVVRLEIRALD